MALEPSPWKFGWNFRTMFNTFSLEYQVHVLSRPTLGKENLSSDQKMSQGPSPPPTISFVHKTVAFSKMTSSFSTVGFILSGHFMC